MCKDVPGYPAESRSASKTGSKTGIRCGSAGKDGWPLRSIDCLHARLNASNPGFMP
ncbi:uncharacterized protein METZ01_LOCUS334569, partial [marine metagenome]